MEFEPHPLLRSPHVQTLLSSRLVRARDGIGEALTAAAETLTLTCRDGIRLKALVSPAAAGSPLVVILHGWLGRADAPYVRRSSAALHAAGFTVARLVLRDHNDTAHLNPGLFNAARIGEVVDACNALAKRYGESGAGLLGFSLGGNFVLRLAAHPELAAQYRTSLAICPVLEPAAAVEALDRGWIGYRRYFLNKWRRAFAEKQAAFPQRYDFTEARRLSMVSTLTDYFVPRHTEFRTADEYYAHYTLNRQFLGRLRIPARVVAAEDDPVLPAEHARALLGHHDAADVVTLIRHGGHCGFIEDFRLTSAVDTYATRYFAHLL